jgi:hypothetical protein
MNRWQGGGAGAAVERRAQQFRGDPDGARRELLVGMVYGQARRLVQGRRTARSAARPTGAAKRMPGVPGWKVFAVRGACRQRRP